jgi:DNA polymerase-3 subunit alpha
MKEILEETYGVMVYQEQVMQISNRIGGYSLGEADLLRRAMGKKKVDEMAQQRAKFVDGAKAKGYAAKKAERVFDQMEKFAGYGFNKSHSAAYAYLAFITAYLKTNYRTEYMSALLTSQTGNTANVVKYINDCRVMGMRVLPPDVNSSDFDFTPDGDAIRFGLGAIKNVGANAVESIVKAREAAGRFGSLYDFCERVDLGAVNRRMIESLIKAGAFDSMKGDGVEGTRAQLTAVIDSAMETGARVWKDRASGQSGLFATLSAEQPASDHPLPKVPDWTAQDKLTAEKETLGFYITGHPLDQHMDKVKELATYTSASLEGLAKSTEVVLCGILTGVQRRRSKEGKLWASMQIEDLEGAVEAMVFSTQYERLLPLLAEDKAVMVRGLVLPEENGPPKISVQDIVPLEVARVNLPSLISIRVPVNGTGPSSSSGSGSAGAVAADRAEALRRLFEGKPGQTEVRLRLEKSRDFSVILDVSARVRPDKEFCAEVARICGTEALEVLAN